MPLLCALWRLVAGVAARVLELTGTAVTCLCPAGVRCKVPSRVRFGTWVLVPLQGTGRGYRLGAGAAGGGCRVLL